MALYDNKYWLLSHIRNSFMSTDDTGDILKIILMDLISCFLEGMCEVVMVGETQDVKEKFFSQEAFGDPDESEDEDDDDETGAVYFSLSH